MAGTIVLDAITDGTGNTVSGSTVVKGSAKAWVNFRGATAAIDSSFNVSSVTRASTGNYTINFTNAFTDTLYVVTGSASTDGVTYNGFLNAPGYTSGKSNTSSIVATLAGTGSAGTLYDAYSVYVTFFR
jgi:hypothetical protein